MFSIHTTATPTATRVRMPASFEVSEFAAPVEGRRMAAGFATCYFGVRVPAILKGVFPGVRAWSPPV